MIRRFIPKGTDFDDMTDDKVEKITAWLNNYPRGIFNYYTSQYFFGKEIQAILTSSQNINKQNSHLSLDKSVFLNQQR